MGNANLDGMTEAFKYFLEEWGTLLNVGLGIATLIGLLAFGYSLTLLIVKADDPRGRQDAISRIWTVAITTMLTGGFWSFVWVFYIIFVGE